MQLIDSPTHIAGNVLDVILTNTDYCQNIDIHPTLPPGLSNWEDMKQYLYSYNFSHIFNSRDIKFIWEQLKVAIFNTINMFVPKVPTRNAN